MIWLDQANDGEVVKEIRCRARDRKGSSGTYWSIFNIILRIVKVNISKPIVSSTSIKMSVWPHFWNSELFYNLFSMYRKIIIIRVIANMVITLLVSQIILYEYHPDLFLLSHNIWTLFKYYLFIFKRFTLYREVYWWVEPCR